MNIAALSIVHQLNDIKGLEHISKSRSYKHNSTICLAYTKSHTINFFKQIHTSVSRTENITVDLFYSITSSAAHYGTYSTTRTRDGYFTLSIQKTRKQELQRITDNIIK